jgi:hypothetical protein
MISFETDIRIERSIHLPPGAPIKEDPKYGLLAELRALRNGNPLVRPA